MIEKTSPFQAFLLILAAISMLYGSTYQQFKHFNLDDPKGLGDAGSYVSMFEGNYEVADIHRYRFIVPYLASLVGKGIELFSQDKKEICKLSFYVVNSLFTTMAALLFFRVLLLLGFDWRLGFLGVLFFLNSRVVVYSVGTPLVDSGYYLSIVAITYLTLTGNGKGLICLNPFFLIAKENIFPFLLVPFFNKKIGKLGILISVVLSLFISYGVRRYIAEVVVSPRAVSGQESFLKIIMRHVESMENNLTSLFSLEGLHDLQHGFSFLLVFAILGYFINQKNRKYEIPRYLLLIIPLSFFFALLSSNLGRLFFSSFVVVLPYSLVFLEYCFSGRKGERIISNP